MINAMIINPPLQSAIYQSLLRAPDQNMSSAMVNPAFGLLGSDLALRDAVRTRNALIAERDAVIQDLDLARTDMAKALKAMVAALEDAQEVRREVRALKAKMAHLPDAPAPDYHGPTTVDGQPVPDETHERFHRSITDVLAGRVMPRAQEQMRDALNRPPLPEPTTASTAKPMPKGAIGFQRQSIGLRVP